TAVSWPSPIEILTPRSQGGSVHDGSCFSAAIGSRDVNAIAITVPHKFYCRERMIPAKVHPPYAWPVRGKFSVVDSNHSFLDGEDSARAQDWNALGSRFQLVRRI